MRNLIYLILLATSIGNGCGQQQDSGNEAQVADTDTKATEQKQDQEPQKDEGSNYNSFAFKSRKQLPACDEKIDGSLAYILDQKIFMNCSEGAWAKIDMGEDEDLPQDMFMYKGSKIFVGPDSIDATYALDSCPTGMTLAPKADILAMINDGSLFAALPALQNAHEHLCLDLSIGQRYVLQTKQIISGTSICHIICK